MSLDIEVVNEIAAEMGVDPAFVEKDWYSVQVLKAISEFQSDTISTVFSGGTSLSKGYGLLERFSEDLDFRCEYIVDGAGHQKKKMRSGYRNGIISTIHELNDINLDESDIEIASNYIKFPLRYPYQLQYHSALRSHLEVEFSFTQPRLAPETQSIQSWVSKFIGSPPEADILCLSPIETGGDKLSALTWRVLKRDRQSLKDDPAMIRHLHDLCALLPIITANIDLFVDTALSSFTEDQLTGARNTEKSFVESMQQAFDTLKSDEKYKIEYQQYVENMSYANDEDDISFAVALDSFECLIALCIKYY